MTGEKKRGKKQQSHPLDGLYRAVTATLGLQQISRLRQDRPPCGTLLAPNQTSHSDNRTQIYAGCLLNSSQGSHWFHEQHLACIISLRVAREADVTENRKIQKAVT